MKILGVIPARYGSTRFEGKPLALIGGHPMIEWVYKRALKSNVDKLVVATDNERIFKCVEYFGGTAVMTSSAHNTGTDRMAEVASHFPEYDVVINIQGDEPLIEAATINKLITAFNDSSTVMGTLKYPIDSPEEINNPNVVKVITDNNNDAIYFSRNPIPYPRDKESARYFRHIGIYGFRRDFLFKYASMPQTLLEKSESLEQLRAMENGYKIKVIETEFGFTGVDTPSDIEIIEKIINLKNIKL